MLGWLDRLPEIRQQIWEANLLSMEIKQRIDIDMNDGTGLTKTQSPAEIISSKIYQKNWSRICAHWDKFVFLRHSQEHTGLWDVSKLVNVYNRTKTHSESSTLIRREVFKLSAEIKQWLKGKKKKRNSWKKEKNFFYVLFNNNLQNSSTFNKQWTFYPLIVTFTGVKYL